MMLVELKEKWKRNRKYKRKRMIKKRKIRMTQKKSKKRREEGKKEERNSLCVFFPTPWKELLKADTLIKYAAACKQWKVSVFVWVELINVVGKPGDVSSPPTLGETPC